jgi:hypothetical protein
MTHAKLFLLAICGASATAGYSQAPLSGTVDASHVKVTISVDRQTYLPGEVAQVTLEVSNPGAAAVLALKPFISNTGCLYLRRRVKDQLRGAPSDECASQALESTDTVKFGPGESQRMVLNSYDRIFDLGADVMEGGAVPELAGDFGISYRYGSSTATAEYKVAPARLEADVTVRVHNLMFTENAELVPPQPHPQYVHVLALRSDGLTHICVQQDSTFRSRLVAREEDVARGPEFDLHHVDTLLATPFKRVATSTNPVVRLSATADKDENLTITWIDSAGREDHLYYPASYPARRPQE